MTKYEINQIEILNLYVLKGEIGLSKSIVKEIIKKKIFYYF